MARYDSTAVRFQLRVSGHAMVRPDGTGFPPGCDITIDPMRMPQAGDYVVASMGKPDNLALAVLSPSPGTASGQLRLEFLNPAFEPITLPTPTAICGVVCEKVTYECF